MGWPRRRARALPHASNNDPGEYAIRFAPSVRGKTIEIGKGEGDLPTLTGGRISIEGDVTILNKQPSYACQGQGFHIASSGNRLSGLRIRGFEMGVVLGPPDARRGSGRTYSGNEFRGLRIDVCGRKSFGFWLAATAFRDGVSRSYPTRNRWLDTRIVGNTISTRFSGIDLQLWGTIGDTIEGLTVSGNRLHLKTAGGEATSGFGVHVSSGGGYGGARQNRVANLLISGNTITGNPAAAIRLAAGDTASRNTLERVRVVRNRIRISPVDPRLGHHGVVVITGDSCSDWHGAKVRPIRCPTRNLVRDVEISGNTFGEGAGVSVTAGIGGGTGNTIRNVRILRNAIRIRIPPVAAPLGVSLETVPGIFAAAGLGRRPARRRDRHRRSETSEGAPPPAHQGTARQRPDGDSADLPCRHGRGSRTAEFSGRNLAVRKPRDHDHGRNRD